MTPEEARQLVGLEGTFSLEELQEACRRRCQDLESRIERAPTPGLKEKYRRSLGQMEEAWEILSGTEGAGANTNFPSLRPTEDKSRADATKDVAKPITKPSDNGNEVRPPPKGQPPYLLIGAIALTILILGGFGYYYGVLVPAEQERQAEIAKQEAIQKEKEAEAQQAADAAEKARLEAEAQKAAAAAEALRTQQEKDREEAERLANARGGLMVNTEPEGATVTLGGEDAQTSPATFKSEKLGSYPIHITLDGYEPVDQTAEIKENQFTDLGTIDLVHSKGSIQITTVPVGLDFSISQNGTVTNSGKTPATIPDLLTGNYDVSVKKGDWEIKNTVTVKRNETATYAPEFATGSVAITSTPLGATVMLGDKVLGTTPVILKEVRPGAVSYVLKLKGYTSESANGTITSKQQVVISTALQALPPIPKEAMEFIGTYRTYNQDEDGVKGLGPNTFSGSITIFIDDAGKLSAKGTVSITWNTSVVTGRVTSARWSRGKLLLGGSFRQYFMGWNVTVYGTIYGDNSADEAQFIEISSGRYQLSANDFKIGTYLKKDR